MLDKLLAAGYKEYSDVISAAVANLLVLHEELGEHGSVVLGEGQRGAQSETAAAHAVSQSPSPTPAASTKKLRQEQPVAEQRPAIPNLFLPRATDASSIKMAVAPDDHWQRGMPVPLNKWVFGQYNRILPAKATCRAIANLLRDHPLGVPVSVAREQIAEAAAVMGGLLSAVDKERQHGRDDALSTAFPQPGEDGRKGRHRFSNQFVVSMNADGQIGGLPYDLKLVNRTEDDEARISLTQVGWQFAALWNPVFDGDPFEAQLRLSPEEVDHLMVHIGESVWVERFAFRATLSAVSAGAQTPDSLDTALQDLLAVEGDGGAFTKSFLSSQRSGTLSRMADLGLIERRRDGVRVFYQITASGRLFAGAAS